MKDNCICEYSIFYESDWHGLFKKELYNYKSVIIYLSSNELYLKLDQEEKKKIFQFLRSQKCILVLVTYLDKLNDEELLKVFDLYYDLEIPYSNSNGSMYDKIYQLLNGRDIYQITLLKSFFSLFTKYDSSFIEKMVAEEARLFCKLVRRKTDNEKRV